MLLGLCLGFAFFATAKAVATQWPKLLQVAAATDGRPHLGVRLAMKMKDYAAIPAALKENSKRILS